MASPLRGYGLAFKKILGDHGRNVHYRAKDTPFLCYFLLTPLGMKFFKTAEKLVQIFKRHLCVKKERCSFKGTVL